MIRCSKILLKMASADVVKRLETRAVAAEKMIEILRQQINEIRASTEKSFGKPEDQEIKALSVENEQLKRAILEQKGLLIAAETKSGIKQVSDSLPVSEPETNSIKEAEKPVEISSGVEGENEKSGKKTEKKKKEKVEKKPQKTIEEATVDVGRLDMRVGLIRTAKCHPDADSLYIEEVDTGEDKPRTVISGLVKFIPLEEMQNRKAILMCNLKPSKMRGIMSEAMVMCASTPEKVEILSPPEESKPGDLVFVDGYERNPDAQLNPKKKIFETCAPDLKVDDNKVATYKGVPWTVNGKHCHAQTLTNVQIK